MKHWLILAVLALLAGCTSAVAGEPRQAVNATSTDQVDHYGLEVDWRDDQKLRLGKEVRKLDPCVLLDEAGHPELGTLLTFGRNGSSLGSVGLCEADLRPRGNPDALWILQVQLGYLDVTAQRVGEVDGVPKLSDQNLTDGKRCGYFLPLPIALPPAKSSNPDVQDVPPAAYVRVSAHGPAEPCAVADKLAKSVLARLRSGVARKDPKNQSVPLTTRDPCALIRRLPKGFSAQTYGFGSPYGCAVYLLRDGSQGMPDTLLIDFRLNVEAVNNSTNGQRRVTLGGHEFIVREFGTACFVTFLTGPVIDVTRDPSAGGTSQDWSLTRAQVVMQSDSCADLQQIAVVLPELYGN